MVEWNVNGTIQRLVLNGQQAVTIGRHPNCDIVLGDPYVSRRHAEIIYKNDTYYIHNLSRTNPLLFNERWALAYDVKADLKPGDSFSVGRIVVKLSLPKSVPVDGKLHIYCPSCSELFEHGLEKCPWCGAEQAEIDTFELEESKLADFN